MGKTDEFKTFVLDAIDKSLDAAMVKYRAGEIGVRDLGSVAESARDTARMLSEFIYARSKV